jgi:hypothetical protein
MRILLLSPLINSKGICICKKFGGEKSSEHLGSPPHAFIHALWQGRREESEIVAFILRLTQWNSEPWLDGPFFTKGSS